MRVIPRRTKVKMEIIKNVTLSDVIFGVIGIAGALGLFLSNFANGLNYWIGIAWVAIIVSLFFKISDNMRLYQTLGYLFRFFAQQKKYANKKIKGNALVEEIIPFVGLYQDRFIDFKEYYAQVIEIQPIVFSLLNEYKREMCIRTFANAIRRLTNDQTATIVKINKAMVLDNYIYNEDRKYDNLMELQYEGEITQKEVEVRAGVFEERVSQMERRNRQEKIYKDYFYIVVYDKDKEILENTINGMITTLAQAVTPITAKRIVGKELLVFLKANYGKEFDERELDTISMNQYFNWVAPNKIKFQAARVMIDNKPYRQFAILDYPIQVPDAWGSSFYLLDRTKVVTKIKPQKKYESEKAIDKAIMEMEAKFSRSTSSSRQIENETHLATLQELLVGLKNNNEQLFDVNIFITCEEPARKEVRAMLRQEGFKYTEMFGRQVDAFISSNISMRDNVEDCKRGIPTTSLAAIFPFISGALQDPQGFYIGDNEFPVVVDFFARNRERVNSNMMVIGKSGSGKSYATKTLLTNFSADNTKIYILDPENEYTNLAINLKGKIIDVGSSQMGIINPFHVFTTLKDDTVSLIQKKDEEGNVIEDEEEQSSSDTFEQHLQFLEQFFRVILEGIESDPFELLNTLVTECYYRKGINENSNFTTLPASAYPIFDDLYDLIKERLRTEKNEYVLNNLNVVETYVKKFAKGGRNSKLWNGPTTLETKENFITFNFQSLLANNNQMVTNAQMLIIFKYLMNEIIKNKDFNAKYNVNRKVIVAVDEAHMFINPKYPIALDFMAQMAKRIRKYGGMQIVITQNIKDFVGAPEIERQSTAIINACQYSCIFSLAPSDMNDLVELYRKSGEINQQEQDTIVTAGVGQAFLITSPMNRTMVQIVAYDYVRKLFS